MELKEGLKQTSPNMEFSVQKYKNITLQGYREDTNQNLNYKYLLYLLIFTYLSFLLYLLLSVFSNIRMT